MQMTQCAGCGIEGMKADTTSGEIVENGEVVATVPYGIEILMVGRANGTCTDDLFCDDCANHRDHLAEIVQSFTV